jgi:Acyl-CoA synthetases (AMP-forming)/AMP-acid ligases II
MITDLPSSFKHTVISDGILSACSQSPSKVAYKHGQKTRTYHELKQRIDSISGIIYSFQIPMKCNIAIVASNSIEYMEIVLAASKLGHPIATVNPKLTANDIVSICEDAEAKLVFVDQKVSSLLVGRNIRGVQEIIGIDNEMETLIAQTECPSQLPTIKEKETFTIPYTSGTTGKQKVF